MYRILIIETGEYVYKGSSLLFSLDEIRNGISDRNHYAPVEFNTKGNAEKCFNGNFDIRIGGDFIRLNETTRHLFEIVEI
jgi:hypothetical protein